MASSKFGNILTPLIKLFSSSPPALLCHCESNIELAATLISVQDYLQADMKVKIEIAQKTADIFYYPDVMVTCDPNDTEKYYKTRPCLIVEVFSPSTEILDRREKRLNYQTLPSLQEYILVSQNEMLVEMYRKNQAGTWDLAILKNGDFLELNSVRLTLAMADIYDEVILS